MKIVVAGVSGYSQMLGGEWYPGLRYTVSYLRKCGLDVSFISGPPSSDLASLVSQSVGLAPELLYLELDQENQDEVFHFARDVKSRAPETRVLLGGAAVTVMPFRF